MTEELSRRRTGGRAGRIAKRQAPQPIEERPIRPGLSGERYKPLTDADIQTVYDTAISLLEDIGMGTPVPEFVEAVTAAGGDRVHFGTAMGGPGEFAKRPSVQALAECLAGLTSVNLLKPGHPCVMGLPSGVAAGMTDSKVPDNDMLGSINRTIRGFEVNAESMSAEVINNVIHGAGHFLGHDQTHPTDATRLRLPGDWRSRHAR